MAKPNRKIKRANHGKRPTAHRVRRRQVLRRVRT